MAAKKKTSKPTTSKKPAAKKKPAGKQGAKPPTAAELAAMFGVTVQKPLPPAAIRRLRKAVPGYVALLDDTAALLEDEGGALQVQGVTPADLLAAQQEQKYLAAREAILYTVYRSVYEQRLQVDDRGMKMIEKIARRVNGLAEDDPSITTRWKVLLDFLSTFRPGAPKAESDAGNDTPAEPPAPPAPAPADG
jgi:hypothetical protein